MFTVALTGGIGSGKSSVADRFAHLGADIIDADVISRALTGAGGEAVPEVIEQFGDAVLDHLGAIDRAALRRVVFGDPNARQRLENILHPRIRTGMQRCLQASAGPYAILVIPLLFETGQTGLADRILVVDVPLEIQIARVQRRSGLTRGEIRQIIATQASRAQRLAGADDVIENTGALAALEDPVRALHAEYLSRASARAPG